MTEETTPDKEQPAQPAYKLDQTGTPRDAKGRILKGAKLRARASVIGKMQGFAAASASRSTTRAQFNRKFVADFAIDWELHGRQALQRLYRESPTNYVKLAAFLVPRQLEVETSTGVKGMSDQQLEDAIALVREMLEQRARALVDVTPATPALPEPSGDGEKR